MTSKHISFRCFDFFGAREFHSDAQMLHFEFSMEISISLEEGYHDFKRIFKMQNLHQNKIRELQKKSKHFKFSFSCKILLYFIEPF